MIQRKLLWINLNATGRPWWALLKINNLNFNYKYILRNIKIILMMCLYTCYTSVYIKIRWNTGLGLKIDPVCVWRHPVSLALYPMNSNLRVRTGRSAELRDLHSQTYILEMFVYIFIYNIPDGLSAHRPWLDAPVNSSHYTCYACKISCIWPNVRSVYHSASVLLN